MGEQPTYFDSESIEKAARDLTAVHAGCQAHMGSKDSYASPAFVEWKKSAITVDDMPMETSSDQYDIPVYDKQDLLPWEDSIKNFIFDVMSLDTSSKFSTCILFSEYGYKYQEATIHIIANKYGKPNSSLIDVVPYTVSDDNKPVEFELKIRYKDADNNNTIYKSIIGASTLTSTVVQWYVAGNTVLFCHDTSIQEYQDSISMMPKSTWSLSCPITNFIINKDKVKCRYVCPNFACAGSSETRAVSTGVPIFTNEDIPESHKGKLVYYSKSIRRSKHFSGKCYDCKKLELAVNSIYRSPLSTPTVSKFAAFTPSFVDSSKRTSNLFSDSGYASIQSSSK